MYSVRIGSGALALAGALAIVTAVSGCASARGQGPASPPVAPSGEPAAGVPRAAAVAEPAAAVAPAEEPAASAQPVPVEAPPEPRLRDLCRKAPAPEGEVVAGAQRRLEETFCGATLWLDGLFGGEADVANARAVSGRVELSTLYTEVDGFEPKGRLRVRYDLPNLERRVNLFLGRDDRDEFVQDRRQGLAIRSSVFDLDREDEWLAGLGYSPPGRWSERVDFRVGGRVKTSPEVFAQGRYRRNFFVGKDVVWRLRETVFWENREGFGSTTSLDVDRVLRQDLLFRWGTVGTFSESTRGVAWRSATVLYHHLYRSRAIAGELFARGDTGAVVDLREYGARAVYRRPLHDRELFGELIVGYTWPREDHDAKREGSAMVGLSVELLFGRDPY